MIARNLGCSSKSVERHIAKLAEKNLILVSQSKNNTHYLPNYLHYHPYLLVSEKTHEFIGSVYEKLVEMGLAKNKTQAEKLLKDELELTPHHLSDTVIQMIPTKLHGNIPHKGSASDMRNRPSNIVDKESDISTNETSSESMKDTKKGGDQGDDDDG